MRTLGPVGVVLLPAEASNAGQNLLVGAGKEGTIYLIDRDNMGHFNPDGGHPDCAIASRHHWPMRFCTPAYFNQHPLFRRSRGTQSNPSPLSEGMIFATPTAPEVRTSFGFPGATPNVSANGTNDAIVWAIQSDAVLTGGPAVLHAYDAADVGRELYNSSQAGTRDIPGIAVKFTVPTVANGKVYVGAQYVLSVFGNLAPSPMLQIALSGPNQITLSWLPAISARLQTTSAVLATNTVWADVGTNNPVTLRLGLVKRLFQSDQPLDGDDIFGGAKTGSGSKEAERDGFEAPQGAPIPSDKQQQVILASSRYIYENCHCRTGLRRTAVVTPICAFGSDSYRAGH